MLRQGELRCDFCASRTEPVDWAYPARDFPVPGPTGGVVAGVFSEGPWAACTPCHALIEAGDWGTLGRRSAANYAVTYEIPAADALPLILPLHAAFRTHRTGPARSLVP